MKRREEEGWSCTRVFDSSSRKVDDWYAASVLLRPKQAVGCEGGTAGVLLWSRVPHEMGGVYHSLPVRLQLVIQPLFPIALAAHLPWHPHKNKSPNKRLSRSRQTGRVAPRPQPLCDCQERRCFSSVCEQRTAPVVPINPNLTDTGSKSTFREPWKLTGEDSLPSPGLTSKPRQQWRLQRKTSTFGRNKETQRVRSTQDSSGAEEWPRVWIPKGHEY